MNLENFSVLVKPASADCNLACAYCFYRPKSALYPEVKRHRMSDAVLAKFIKDYMALVGTNASFGWQGGEPLLMGLDFFQKVVTYQQRFGRSGQIVANGFQTNATLIDDDWARLFRRYNFLVGVSLDGPKEIHDFYRCSSAGRPSFDRVMTAIDTLKRHGAEFNILTLLNPRNVSRATELYNFFVGQGFRYLQFIPCIEPDPVTGQATDFSITPEQYGEFLCELFDLWIADGMPSTYIRMFDALLMHYAINIQPSCQFQEKCASYIVVEYNGDVYPCDFFVEPEWFLGNLMETPLQQIIASDKFASFGELKSQHTQECLECRWLSRCHGACTRHRVALGNDVAHPSYFCPSYKQFFEYSHQRFRELSRKALAMQQKEQSPNAQYSQDIESPLKPPPNIQATEVEDSQYLHRKGKIGRNDPCPCGSGKKYKHCCLK